MYDVEVEMEDGTVHRVSVDGRDIRFWEAENRESFLTTDFSYSALTDLARLALRRTGKTQLSKGEFDAACVSVKEVSKAEPEDPTQSAPTEEPSSSSPSEPGSASAGGKKRARQP